MQQSRGCRWKLRSNGVAACGRVQLSLLLLLLLLLLLRWLLPLLLS